MKQIPGNCMSTSSPVHVVRDLNTIELDDKIMLTIFIVLSAFMAALFPIANTLATTQNDEIGDSNQTRDEIIEELQKNPNICQIRALNGAQQLSERQCFFFNSCLNLTGGSIVACYNAARDINFDIENGPWHCPPVAMDQN